MCLPYEIRSRAERILVSLGGALGATLVIAVTMLGLGH
jgi:hypothetical protein